MKIAQLGNSMTDLGKEMSYLLSKKIDFSVMVPAGGYIKLKFWRHNLYHCEYFRAFDGSFILRDSYIDEKFTPADEERNAINELMANELGCR